MPMRRGSRGIAALAAGTEQTFGFELAVDALAVHLSQSDAFGKQQVGDELAGAVALVEVDFAVGNQRQAVGGHDRRVEGAAAEQNARSWDWSSFSEK